MGTTEKEIPDKLVKITAIDRILGNLYVTHAYVNRLLISYLEIDIYIYIYIHTYMRSNSVKTLHCKIGTGISLIIRKQIETSCNFPRMLNL